MRVHMLWNVALCVTILTHICLSAIISPNVKNLSKEQRVKKELGGTSLSEASNKEDQDINIISEQKPSESNKQDQDINIITEQKSSESSESSSSEEKNSSKSSNSDSSSSKSSNSDSSSSESSEIEKSKEKNKNKTRPKRSLDSDQGSLNKINEENPETDSVTNDDTETTSKDNADVTSTTESRDTTEEQSSATPVETETTTTATTETESVSVSEASEKDADSSSETNSDDDTPQPSEPSDATEPSSSGGDNGFTKMALARADKLSEQIRKILMHYRKAGEVVVPGQSFFPEPMVMQDFEKSFSIGTINFKNMIVHGLSNFTVEHINTDVDQMQVYILLHMKQLLIVGNYSLRTFWSRSAGPFNVTLLNVSSEGVAAIETTQDGHLEASDSEMDMYSQQMLVDFKGLGSMLQSIVNSVGDALFDSIKPQILEKVNLVIRNDVNKKLKEFSTKFVNKVSPVDLAFSEGRRYVREHGYDPLHIKQHTFIVGGIVHINISDLTLKGLSRFNRAGNLSLSMDAGIIQFGIHVLTRNLSGSFKWSGDAFGIARNGKTNFTIDQLQVRCLVNQSLDITQKPKLDQLDLHLGWLKVTMDSPMALTTMVQGIINAFPRLIKHMIVDSLEMPLKEKIQEILNEINVESFVDSNLPQLDNYGL